MRMTIDSSRQVFRGRQNASTTRLLVLPPSPYALEFADVVGEIPETRVEGFIECRDRERCRDTYEGLPVHWVDELQSFSETHLAACAMGTTHRDEYIRRALLQGIRFPALQHPTARVSRTAVLAAGVFVDVYAVVSSYSSIGRHSRIKRGAMIGHHTEIGDYVSVQPGANVAGHCRIGNQTFIGMSAVVVDHVSIGEQSVVAAGAVVTKDVPDRVMVAGVPARIHREDISGR